MPKSKTKGSKRTLPTPEKVCDTPIPKRITMNDCSPIQLRTNVNMANMAGMNNGFVPQVPVNTTMSLPIQNPVCSQISQMSQAMPYGAPVQNISNPLPGTQIQHQHPLVYNIQQSPTAGGLSAQSVPSAQPLYQDSANALVMSDIQAILQRLEARIETVDSKINKLHDIEKTVTHMSSQINKFESRVTSLESAVTKTNSRVSELENSRAFDSQTCEEVSAKCKDLEGQLKSESKKCESLQKEITEAKCENQRLNEEILDVQTRSMRDNLLFHGIKECDSFEERRQENCVDAILKFCSDELQIENTQVIKIDRAHRLGKFRADKPRPIVAKFNFYPDKVMIKQKAFSTLQQSNYRVSDQYPREIQERRRIIYPEFQKALNEGKRAVMSYDKLYIDGRTITSANIRAREGEASA